MAFHRSLFNAPRAHDLKKTDDWVVIFCSAGHHAESQCTVVTETSGPQRGKRVVRGRERECTTIDQPAPTRVVSQWVTACRPVQVLRFPLPPSPSAVIPRCWVSPQRRSWSRSMNSSGRNGRSPRSRSAHATCRIESISSRWAPRIPAATRPSSSFWRARPRKKPFPTIGSTSTTSRLRTSLSPSAFHPARAWASRPPWRNLLTT